MLLKDEHITLSFDFRETFPWREQSSGTTEWNLRKPVFLSTSVIHVYFSLFPKGFEDCSWPEAITDSPFGCKREPPAGQISILFQCKLVYINWKPKSFVSQTRREIFQHSRADTFRFFL